MRLLVAYFATAKQATAALAAGIVPTGSGESSGIESMQAGTGGYRRRILILEYEPVGSNQNVLFNVRYCATGVPVPSGM
jgi:hypothetical protein